MPGTSTTNAGDGGGTLRYFRISNKEALRWNGTNVDATPSGLSVTSIDKPESIDVQDADKQLQSGYITLNYADHFTLALTQGSRLEAGVDLLRKLIALPSVASGGGSQAVAQALSTLVSAMLARVPFIHAGEHLIGRMDGQHRPFGQHIQLRIGDHGGDLDDGIRFRLQAGHFQVDPDQVVTMLHENPRTKR